MKKSEEIQRLIYCGIFQPWSTVWGRCALLSKFWSSGVLFWSRALLFFWVIQLISSWSLEHFDQWSKLTGLTRHGNLHLGLPGNLCLKIVLLVIDSVKCSRHKSWNINSNSTFIVLTINHCHQDYVFWYSFIGQYALWFLVEFCLRFLGFELSVTPTCVWYPNTRSNQSSNTCSNQSSNIISQFLIFLFCNKQFYLLEDKPTDTNWPNLQSVSI